MVQFYMFVIRLLYINMPPGVSPCVPSTLTPKCMGSYHGQILIETETYSFLPSSCPKGRNLWNIGDPTVRVEHK